MNELENKLYFILYECNKHNQRMQSAVSKMQAYIPLDKKRYDSLTEDEIEHMDQYLFRFAKLQDTIGEKLFPNLLLLLGEKVKKMPFLDMLNRLEELELVEKEIWIKLRIIRNAVSHEYPFEKKEIIGNLNSIIENSDRLKIIFEKIFIFCKERFAFIKNQKFD